jgi:hypothetical protein
LLEKPGEKSSGCGLFERAKIADNIVSFPFVGFSFHINNQ